MHARIKEQKSSLIERKKKKKKPFRVSIVNPKNKHKKSILDVLFTEISTYQSLKRPGKEMIGSFGT